MYKTIKRGADVFLSLFLLILFAPLMAAVAWLIRLDSEGNSLFTQWRTGRDGRPFIIYKFRTMRDDAPHDLAAAVMNESSKYVTRLGRFLRRSSVDELPQLFNVLKGDMSFVGPRPVVLTERDLIALRRQNGADRVRPGITGLAQVIDRTMYAPQKKAFYDAWYADNFSFRVDIQLILLTARRFWKR